MRPGSPSVYMKGRGSFDSNISTVIQKIDGAWIAVEEILVDEWNENEMQDVVVMRRTLWRGLGYVTT